MIQQGLSPEKLQWGVSKANQGQCRFCVWARPSTVMPKHVFRCLKLAQWTWWDFSCLGFSEKAPYCEYVIEGTRYRHYPDCVECRLDPRTCRRSWAYDPGWRRKLLKEEAV